jgi:hypothetical protein
MSVNLIDMTTNDDDSETFVPSGPSTPITPEGVPAPNFTDSLTIWIKLVELDTRLKALEGRNGSASMGSESSKECNNGSDGNMEVDIENNVVFSVLFTERVVISLVVLLLWLCIGSKYVFAE